MIEPKNLISGAGGGGDGQSSSRTPVESADSIRSKQFARVLDMLGEGEIVGLVNGDRSVYFDDTPLQNADGSYNFSDVTIQTRNGTQGQTYINGFHAAEAENSVGVQVIYSGAVTRSITNSAVNLVRVSISIPRLVSIDAATGDAGPTTVQYAIDIQANGGGYVAQPLGYDTVNGSIVDSTGISPALSVRLSGQCSWSKPVTLAPNQDFYDHGIITYNVDYKLTSSGSWTTHETITLSDELNGQTIEGQRISFSVPEGTYNLRVIKTSGSGNINLTGIQGTAQVNYAVVSGKNTTKYVRSHVMALTGSAPWDIRVRRLTANSASQNLVNQTWWESYTEIIDTKLSYPNSALVGVQIDSSQFKTIPRRAYHIKGLKVQIPDNYNPITRVYTGIWGGTFTTAWTDNPAWCFYDLITNTRYGLGKFISTSLVDKATLYTIGQYCDEYVADGLGGSEPRFTCNLYLQTQEEAFKVVMNLASIFRGMAFWKTDSISAIQDAPASVWAQFTNADIIGGEFNYSGSASKARHTVALVTWNDPADMYKQKIEYVEDTASITLYGINEIQFTAFGCTSRGQAHRAGKWLLYSERLETEVVSFKTGLKGTTITPGVIIRTMDQFRSGIRYGGRVISSTATSITLDSSITIVSGKTYTISLVLPDGTLIDKTITNAAGTYTTITVSTMAIQPQAYAIWVITSTDITPELWRVISITEDEPHIYTVSALEHNISKYAAVEQDLLLETPPTSLWNVDSIGAVTNISITDTLYLITTDATGIKITLDWTPVTGARDYQVRYRYNSGNYKTITTSSSDVEILDASEGNYEFTITAFNGFGVPSIPITVTKTILTQSALPQDVTGFKINVLNGQAHLAWTAVSDLDLSHYRLRFSPTMAGVTWSNSFDLVERIGKPATSIAVPSLIGTYLIKAVDFYGNESANSTSIITNISQLDGFNAISTLTESTTFTGTKTGCAVVSNALKLSGNTMSNWTSLSIVPNLYQGSGAINNSGTYLFANTLDLGGIFTSRLTAILRANGENLANVIFGWASLSSVITLSGAVINAWSVDLQVRTTNDNPAGSPIWSAWKSFIVGDYSARAFEFRLLLASSDTNVTPNISVLSVTIDMPDRSYGQNDVVCGTTGLTITYSPAFKAAPALAISAQGLQTGDYYDITSKSATGFTIIFRNSATVAVSRTFDYLAKGYGYVI